MAKLDDFIPADPTHNTMLHSMPTTVVQTEGGPQLQWAGRDVKVAHFVAEAKSLFGEYTAMFIGDKAAAEFAFLAEREPAEKS